jgi:hypothetical protein
MPCRDERRYILMKKQQLLKNLERLPESDVQEILDFADFIVSRRSRMKKIPSKKKLAPEKDPILKLMGIADVEPFADKIDRELYGQ